MIVVVSLSVLFLCGIRQLQGTSWPWKEEGILGLGLVYVFAVYLIGGVQWN